MKAKLYFQTQAWSDTGKQSETLSQAVEIGLSLSDIEEIAAGETDDALRRAIADRVSSLKGIIGGLDAQRVKIVLPAKMRSVIADALGGIIDRLEDPALEEQNGQATR